MTDWAMVVLTAIYVLATILICYYNYGATKVSQTARSVVKQTGCFVGRSRAAVSGGRCVLSPPDCFVA